MAIHILGIRHHGVGSAKKVAARLEEIKPDIVLVEGPPEITEALREVGRPDLVPPVAIMVYNPKSPAQSSFYPFASFSPEWIAARYANEKGIPIKALDLPAGTRFKQQDLAAKRAAKELEAVSRQPVSSSDDDEVDQEHLAVSHLRDPLSYLADIDGFASGESWWEYQFESANQTGAREHFEAVMLTMKSLREAGIASSLDTENVAREAFMRSIIQRTINDMYSNIAVICGAWHAPELEGIDDKAKEDQRILKKLPKAMVEVSCTWIPWTNSRLSMFSGYGAGLQSPGWYEHQWKHREDIEVQWLSKIARAFREEDVDVSTAHVLETYRLAHAITALRSKAHISLAELNEAVHTVMCMGDAILFELVKKKIVVGEKLGRIPEDLPKLPLQRDFESNAKSLRLSLSAEEKQLDLDLRKPIHLKRSVFFHRLELLDIGWAHRTSSRSKGTFKESWQLEWQPKMHLALIDKSYFGNTIETAALALVEHRMKSTQLISDLVRLVEFCIPSELFEAVDKLLIQIRNETAISSDTFDLMSAIPGMVDVIKYNDVRNSDRGQLGLITSRLITKTCLALPNACYGLDEDSSNNMFHLITGLHNALMILEDEDMFALWYKALKEIVATEGIHKVIQGCTIRLLFDNKQLEQEKADTLFSYYLSVSSEPSDVAYWIEGFLKGSGSILIYDDRIWNLVYQWVDTVSEEVFMELLPVLRRAFSRFQYGERRQIGEKASQGTVDLAKTGAVVNPQEFDEELAGSVLPFIQRFLA